MKDVLRGVLKKRESCVGKASLKRRDYCKYRWKRGERAGAMAVSAAVTVFLAYFFYRSLWAAPALLPVGAAFYSQIRRNRGEREREELAAQFRECILAVSTLLGAGYSVENAFQECGQDMALMYGRDALICRELELISSGLHINIPLEELLADLGERSGCEEIIQFGEVFSIAKRSGGNLAEIIESSADLIGRKAEVKREVNTLLSGRKMELNIMEIMPFAILTYIGVTTPGYFDMLYSNSYGRLIMTGCLAAYVGAYALGEFVFRRMRRDSL